MNYYNEFDPKAAAWLRELIKAGEIPNGEVDERSIAIVQPSDLAGFTQCHFFAGIGGWSYALRLAGWPESEPVWTGSCPCQPFSSAGKQLGNSDERHLWPAFFNLIRQCRPLRVFGEQVASAIGHGWLDGISADLESEGYTCGAVVLGAHSVGAPHIRQRLYWLGDTNSPRSQGRNGQELRERADEQVAGPGSASCGVANTICADVIERAQAERKAEFTGRGGWGDYQLIPCRDGKSRRIESGTFPLAHGIPGRVGLLRGYGNAIVPQTAAEFIQAYCDLE